VWLMKLGYALGYWGRRPPAHLSELLTEAVDLGVESVWTAEAYGSDALMPLAWWGSRFPTLRLGTAIAQLSARTPTATAMAALTLDHLSGGRFVLGLGVSGPQVVEGWYGDVYAKPLSRTREYVEIIRKVLARDVPVVHEGQRYQLPRPGGTGLGKPLRSIVEPLRSDLPILLAAEGPKNVALAAEIGDGWLAFLYSPHHHDLYAPSLETGFARRTGDLVDRPFEIVASAPVVVQDDVHVAADFVRPVLALYIGGMGAKSANFHHEVAVRMGYDAVAKEVQRLYLDGAKKEAEAALPLSLIEKLALVGPPAKIADDLAAWKESPVDTLMVQGDVTSLRAVAAAL
jgi:F420-dependent oxidoreductase-like protein